MNTPLNERLYYTVAIQPSCTAHTGMAKQKVGLAYEVMFSLFECECTESDKIEFVKEMVNVEMKNNNVKYKLGEMQTLGIL